LNLGPQQLCGLLAVLPAAENCACAAQVFPLENFALSHAERKLCDKSPVQVGVAQRPGASYEWKTPALLACTTCATTTLVPDPNLPPGQSQVLVLEESSPGCRTVHRFTLSFGQTATASANNSAICKGKSVTLSAFGEAATQYAWSGQGLLNPAAAQSTASPATSQTYFVTVTFAGGCTATASVSVAVLNSDSVQLPVRTTCPGTPVQMPGKLTDQAGIYSFTYPKSNGCDSTVWQQLKVLDKISTSANLSACRGDTLWVFGKPVTQNTQECRPFIASNGCDSVHCIAAKFRDLNPVLPSDPDTIFREAGTLVTLSGPSGYASYTWSPLPDPPCSNCREIEVEADSARLLTYTLTVRDPQGCTGDITYRVLFSPPCAQLRIVLPTAFTPNGDGVNDVFRAVPFEDGGTLAGLSIYDRWGKKVYENTREAAWDGTLDGKEAQGDVYVWVIEILCGDERVKKVGEVTLLR
ncbi:MAG TPA: gliding motility-associated C-terminal domain-containing protein, partial [Saprospiraceae bacterium]|nr:gliding motility-associated C-terminal domain-containing protein [Saprospiraceae bacterium]